MSSSACTIPTSPPARRGAGDVVGALIGLGETDHGDLSAAEEYWSLDDAIPKDSAAAIALIEHRWAIGTRDAIRAAGASRSPTRGSIRPTLAAAGLIDAEDATAAGWLSEPAWV